MPKSEPKSTNTSRKNEYVMKYNDKSAGQPEMAAIFQLLKTLVLPYEKGHIRRIGGDGGQLSLINTKPVEVNGKIKEDVWFVSILVQKGYVGFYYMPIYTHPQEIRSMLSPALLRLLKGKSCFHIKRTDPLILDDVRKALQIGHELWEKDGWL